MNPEVRITTATIDDFPLLLAMIMRLGLPEITDWHIQRLGLQRRLSWGWLAAIWLAHILTESDHRKEPEQAWAQQVQETIRQTSG